MSNPENFTRVELEAEIILAEINYETIKPILDKLLEWTSEPATKAWLETIKQEKSDKQNEKD